MLKSILAPVDFSKTSRNALSFAAELCKRAGAGLTIMHILAEGGDEAEANQKLTGIQSELKELFGSELRCSTYVAHAEFVVAMETSLAVLQPDLIVMGTKGASGLKRIFIGSNTVKVIANTTVPVLVIPDVARFEDFDRKGKNRIILAADLQEVEDDNALDILKEIALLMIEPRIRVLSVRPENSSLDFNKGMERAALVSRFQPEIESERVTVFSNGVIDGINYYLDKHDDTGLVTMIARDSGKLIEKHHTHEMASITRYPLLVLHDKKE